MMHQRKRGAVKWSFMAVVLAVGGALAGCNTSSPTQPLVGDAPLAKASLYDAAWIGTDGGTLQVGPYRLEVPAGAVGGNTYFELEQVAAGNWPVDLSPHGIPFNTPVTLVFDAASEPDPSSMDVQWWNPATQQWEVQVSAHNGTEVSASLQHFSRYTIF